MAHIAVVGAKGFVGSALVATFRSDASHEVAEVVRETYDKMRGATYDIIINAAMPSARFWAKDNPTEDFTETVQKTADLVHGWKYGKFIQISTVSARCQLDTVYGRNKAAAEKICGFGDNLIVRLGPMYSENLKKGVLIDMLKGQKVFVDGRSRYCFTPLEYVGRWLTSNFEASGVREVGARGAVALSEIADHLGKKIEFEGVLDDQEIKDPPPDAPDARDVLSLLDIVKNKFQY